MPCFDLLIRGLFYSSSFQTCIRLIVCSKAVNQTRLNSIRVSKAFKSLKSRRSNELRVRRCNLQPLLVLVWHPWQMCRLRVVFLWGATWGQRVSKNYINLLNSLTGELIHGTKTGTVKVNLYCARRGKARWDSTRALRRSKPSWSSLGTVSLRTVLFQECVFPHKRGCSDCTPTSLVLITPRSCESD